jgi:hypothetical protein
MQAMLQPKQQKEHLAKEGKNIITSSHTQKHI